MKDIIKVEALYQKMQDKSTTPLVLPPSSFTMMHCEMIAYDEKEMSLVVQIPLSPLWLNPYGTMQGGLIEAAIDNTVGPLSLLVAPMNMTRSIETKFIKAVTLESEHIYVHAKLIEHRKKRLTFEVSVQDKDGEIFTKSKVVNFIL